MKSTSSNAPKTVHLVSGGPSRGLVRQAGLIVKNTIKSDVSERCICSDHNVDPLTVKVYFQVGPKAVMQTTFLYTVSCLGNGDLFVHAWVTGLATTRALHLDDEVKSQSDTLLRHISGDGFVFILAH